MVRSIRSGRFIFVLALTIAMAGWAWAQTPNIPTADQLRQMYDAGQYHPCLQMISKLLFLKGAAAQNVDRPRLLLLRGDCLVKLKDSRTALKAYKDAEAAATDEPEIALQARGSALILQNCRGLTYMPPGINPIDVTTNDGWKQAATAIYNTTWQNSQADLTAAQSAQDIGPIIQVVPTIANLVALDQITRGDPSQLVPTIRSIGQRARDIITQYLNQQDATTASVEQNANQVLNYSVGTFSWDSSWSPTVRRGLETPDRDALDKVVDGANQAYDLAVQGKKAAYLVGGAEGLWQGVIDHAVQVRDHAQRVLDAE